MKVVEINMDNIVPPGIRMRHNIDPVEIEELAKSIDQIGLLQPILVLKENGRYKIVAGERRYLAMKKLGKETISCIVWWRDENQAVISQIVENIQRTNTTPLEEADMIITLKHAYEISSKKIAELLGKSEGWVSQRLAVEKWEKELYDAVRGGKITFSVAREIDAEKNPEYRAQLLQDAVVSGMTADEVALRRRVLNDLEQQIFRDDEEQTNDGGDLVGRYREKLDAVRCVVCGSAPGVYDISWVSVCQRCLKKSQTG